MADYDTDAVDEDVADENRRRVVAYLQAGEKGPAARDGGLLGLEVEHFAVFDDGMPVTYLPQGGRAGVLDLLEALVPWFGERDFSRDGSLVGVSGPAGSVTLEPAAQVEASVAPFASVTEVGEAYDVFLDHAGDFLAERGARLVTLGAHPTRRAFDLPLIPKDRYLIMDEHLVGHVGDHGERMMRASASTQVSVDYADEADAVRKLRLASALAPILGAIADNLLVFEGEPNHLPLRRLEMWRHVDPARCGVVPGVFDEGFGFGAYADWLLGTSPIFVTRPAADDPEGPAVRAFFDEPASVAYGDAPMSEGDVGHLLSVFWPDARIKQVIEVRPADSLPPAEALGYAALIKGLFYSEASRSAVESMLGVTDGRWPLGEKDVERARLDVSARGWGSTPYGIPLAEWERELFGLARAALLADERPYLDPLEAFSAKKPWWLPSA